ncbi:hypothetical protein FHS16_005455, partial [Paenibacillus endophyticus]|nr:hypothetical protein [Paenibacillus endophyticus]
PPLFPCAFMLPKSTTESPSLSFIYIQPGEILRISEHSVENHVVPREFNEAPLIDLWLKYRYYYQSLFQIIKLCFKSTSRPFIDGYTKGASQRELMSCDIRANVKSQ